ncbi:MAG: crossover junction endodeoxyribonuclease RuvC [Candidatus Binatota bacterium]|nr:crossover junction endodeoxyribonuclease RuvC [Candidatus Binatota bacterium]
MLGVDPGTRITGWAVVEALGTDVRRIASGALRLGSLTSLPDRLRRMHAALGGWIRDHGVAAVGLEQAFVARNVQSALRLGESRGVVLLAAAEAGLPVFEYSPAAVKHAVVGYGRADKGQMVRGIAMLLSIEPPDGDDEADALAVALCHVHGHRIRTLLDRAR